jgi:hypothetical protein
MKGNLRPADRGAYLAAIEHFPHRETVMRRLMERDEAFRAVCAELSETKAALAGHSDLQEADSQKQRDERLERVGCLVAEILAALMSQKQLPSRHPEARATHIDRSGDQALLKERQTAQYCGRTQDVCAEESANRPRIR